MFLNRVDKSAELVAALEKERGLDAVGARTGIARDRLEALRDGKDHIMPAEEWALIGFCDTENLYQVLLRNDVASPLYNRYENFSFESKPLGREQTSIKPEIARRPTNILGYEVDFPLGVPACALTPNHEWLRFFAERGFSILTHKTVRSGQWGRWQGHKPPHWAFAKRVDGALQPPEFRDARVIADMQAWPQHPAYFSMVNSFGVPSLLPNGPRGWQEEIAKERRILKPGTVLIVSVMGTPEKTETQQDLIDDFALTARLAKEAGAQIIEANYSCPNTPPGEGGPAADVYTSPELSAAISAAIRSEIGEGFPFLIKIGYLPDARLREVVRANRESIDGVVAINTIRMKVDDETGKDFFPGRPEAGASGSIVKPFAKEVLTNLVLQNEEEKLDLAILGVGGVTTAEDVDEFLDLGITAVLSCTGAYMNPYLAIEARLAQRVDREKLRATFGDEVVAQAERIIVKSNV